MSRAARVQVRAHAKLNLHLEILGRRRDGFHEIRTLMQTVSLFDRLTLRPHPRDIVLRVTPPGLDAGPANLVVRALEALRKHSRVTVGAEVRLWKRIPVGAGMGGGSSDAAAALRAGCRLWGVRPGPAVLQRLAAALGSDVPFFLVGGAAWMGGRGERTLWRGRIPAFRAVVAWPGFEVSSREAYAALNFPLTPPGGVPSIVRRSLPPSMPSQFVLNGYNAFAPWLLRHHSELRTLAALLARGGADAVRPTGSGSALFGMLESARAARSLTLRLRRAGYLAWSVTPTGRGSGLLQTAPN